MSLTAARASTPRYVGEWGRGLASPAGLTLDSGGILWVADTYAGQVAGLDRRGRRIRALGEHVLAEPRDVAVARDRVYVADSGRDSVEVFTPTGRHVASVGRGQLLSPRGVVVDGLGRIVVSDVGNNRVARFDPSSYELVGAITDGVHIPHGLAVDGDGLWVVSSSRQYDGDCQVTRFVADAPTVSLGLGQHSTFGSFSNPAHVAVGADGSVLVSVPDYGFVSRFTIDGEFVDEFGTSGPGLLRNPLGLAVTPNGEVLVADQGGRRIVRFASRRAS